MKTKRLEQYTYSETRYWSVMAHSVEEAQRLMDEHVLSPGDMNTTEGVWEKK